MLSSSTVQGDQTSGTFNGAQISFCHTSRTTLSTTFTNNYSGNTPVMMLSQPALSFNWTAGAWNEIPLTNTFNYSGTSNLLIEIKWNSSGSSLLSASSSLAQNCILGSSVGATSGSYYYRMCMRVHYIPTTPFIIAQGTQVNAGDGLVDPGESIQLICQLKNTGVPATNLTATLSSTNIYCSITQSNWVPGIVNTGVTVSNPAAPFAVTISPSAPLGASLPFKLSVSASGGYTTNLSFNVPVAKSQLSIHSVVVNDLNGNANMALNPNERVQLLVGLTNSGATATGVVATLSCSNSKVSLVSSTSAYGAISKLTKSSNANAPFCIQMASDAWANGCYPFSLALSYNGGSTTSCAFMVASDFATSASGTSSWINTAGGTAVSLGDEAGTYVNIGFAFPYYGQTYTQIGVVDNGYLDIPTANLAYINAPLPSAVEPNGMIAPYWDDLDPASGGTIRTLLTGSSTNRIFVVEWNGVPRYGVAGSSVSCQALLHENGKIIFQYGPMTGTSVYGASATIGIESADGSQGVQYSYNQANAVTNGTSITFDVAKPPTDSDGDGLPNAIESIYAATSTSLVPGADSDGDGQSNLNELHSGTNPYDSGSVLKVSSAIPNAGLTNCVVSWQSVPGMLYRIYSTTNLSGTWSNKTPSAVVGSNTGSNQYTVNVSVTNSPLFLRISTSD